MKLASYLFVFLAGAIASDVTRPNAAPQVSTASTVLARDGQHGPLPAVAAPRPNVPFAYDFMSFQVVDGEVEPRFYCSSRCRRELDKRGLR